MTDHIEFTSEVEYQAARALVDEERAWYAQFTKPNGWIITNGGQEASKPAHLRAVTNAMKSALEVWEFKATPPLKYFLYITAVKPESNTRDTGLATTWTGQYLGRVHFGRPYQSPAFGCFPSTRVPVTVYAINGAVYVGTYFKSSGDYARVRMTADSRRKLGLDKAA